LFLLGLEGLKHRNESRFSQKARNSFLFSPTRDAPMAAAHHHQMALYKILVVLIQI